MPPEILLLGSNGFPQADPEKLIAGDPNPDFRAGLELFYDIRTLILLLNLKHPKVMTFGMVHTVLCYSGGSTKKQIY